MIRPALATFAALAPLLPAQEVVARFTLDGEPAAVTADELARELGRRYGRTDQGRQAREFLIQLELVRSAAQAKGLMPTANDTLAWIARLEARLEASGASLAALMAQKGMTRAEFEPFAAIQLAQERLVRDELDLAVDEPVPPGTMELWLSDAREARGVETRPTHLASGVVARIGNRDITELELGHALARTTDAESRRSYTLQIVLRRCLEAEAKREGIDVDRAEMEREVEARRREANSNPQYRGVPFEQLLAAQGTTPEELVESPVLRAQVLERKLLDRAVPPAELERQLDTERDVVLRRHGPRRRLEVILVRDIDGEDSTRARADEIRGRIEREIPFHEAARTYSDDAQGRIAGGDVGWHYAEGSFLPAAVVEAGFAGEVGTLSSPVRTDEGYYLVRVAAAEPAPSRETLLFRMRQAASEEQRAKILERAQVQILESGT